MEQFEGIPEPSVSVAIYGKKEETGHITIEGCVRSWLGAFVCFRRAEREIRGSQPVQARGGDRGLPYEVGKWSLELRNWGLQASSWALPI